jgi:nicotinate-nucleotide pyrophosphorylase (carboxylating)
MTQRKLLEVAMQKELIRMALQEDLGSDGDVTSEAIFSDEQAEYWLIAKAEGVICGIEVGRDVLQAVDPAIQFETEMRDGDRVTSGQEIGRISGPTVSVLQAERTFINFISHLSGISTATARFVEAADGKVKILDTRKTLPGWRSLQKYAVKCGGGTNHRMGLYDMVMIKDNHVDEAGGVAEAIERVREKWGDRFSIEVETRTLKEVIEAVEAGADIIMLDNMDNTTMHQAVELIGGRAKTEASGNMTVERVAGVATTGVDFISVGALTHSVIALDFSLRKREDV